MQLFFFLCECVCVEIEFPNLHVYYACKMTTQYDFNYFRISHDFSLIFNFFLSIIMIFKPFLKPLND